MGEKKNPLESLADKIAGDDPEIQAKLARRRAEREKKYEKSDGCYIATAIYGSYDCPQVLILRSYRDDKLTKNKFGRLFICTYYAVSPQIVKWFSKNEWFNHLGRIALDKFVKNLRDKGYGDTL